jgi:hypothetical protein
MLGWLRSLLGKIVAVVALVVAAYAGWIWGPLVFPRIQDWMGMSPPDVAAGPAPSAELADSVLSRVQAFPGGVDGEIALSGREVTSVIRYSVPGLIPSGIRDPEVTFQDGHVFLSAEVILASFPNLPDLGPILGMLPDTLHVEMEASLMPYGAEESALLIHGLEASRIPIPRRLIPEILRAMGRTDRPGLPPEAMAVPLPASLGAVYILADSLIISSNSSNP